MPPRDYGEREGCLKEEDGERKGGRFTGRETEKERRKVAVDGESKAENPKGSTRLEVSSGRSFRASLRKKTDAFLRDREILFVLFTFFEVF